MAAVKQRQLRPNDVPTEIRSLARSFANLSIRTLAGICQHSENDNARVAAANSLLDRGFGKVATQIEADGELVVTIRTFAQRADEPAPLVIEHEPSDESDEGR